MTDRQPLLSRAPVEGMVLLIVAGLAAVPLAANGLITAFHCLGIFYGAMFVLIARVRFLRLLWAVTALWCATQVASDVWQGTQVFSGMAAVGPLAALTATILYWLHHVEGLSARGLAIAISVGWIGLVIIRDNAGMMENPWKYGLGPPITLLVLLLLSDNRRGRTSVTAALMLLATISLWSDSRFYFALHAVVLLGVLFSSKRTLLNGRKLGWTALFAALALYVSYPLSATSGILGDRAQHQQEKVALANGNFVIASRPEFPQALHIVAQHPILGIGSNATLGAEDRAAAIAFAVELGAVVDPSVEQYLNGGRNSHGLTFGYAAHSAALDSAVHGGLLALPFWFFTIGALLRGAFRTRERSIGASAASMFLIGLTVWDALFSPLTSVHHVQLGLALFLATANRDPSTRYRLWGSRGPASDEPNRYALVP